MLLTSSPIYIPGRQRSFGRSLQDKTIHIALDERRWGPCSRPVLIAVARMIVVPGFTKLKEIMYTEGDKSSRGEKRSHRALWVFDFSSVMGKHLQRN